MPTASKKTRRTGSDNIFEVLGVPNAEEHALKADIVIKLAKLIETKKLSQVAVARLTGISQPDLSRLLRGHFQGFSLDRLLHAFAALGSDIEIRVKKPVASRRGNVRVLAEAFT